MPSNTDVILAAMPLLEAMKLDNLALADDYLSCQWGDFQTRLLLRVAYELGLILKKNPDQKRLVLSTYGGRDPINRALSFVRNRVNDPVGKKLSLLHPTTNILNVLRGEDMGEGASMIVAPLAVKNGIHLDVLAGDEHIIHSATHDELFGVCKYLLASTSDIMYLHQSFLSSLAEMWVDLRLEEQAWFPDLAQALGDLHVDMLNAKKTAMYNLLLNYRTAHELDYADIRESMPYGDLPYCHMIELYLDANIGKAPTHYSKRMLEIMDYHFQLILGGV